MLVKFKSNTVVVDAGKTVVYVTGATADLSEDIIVKIKKYVDVIGKSNESKTSKTLDVEETLDKVEIFDGYKTKRKKNL